VPVVKGYHADKKSIAGAPTPPYDPAKDLEITYKAEKMTTF
jgi:hypothetical protein